MPKINDLTELGAIVAVVVIAGIFIAICMFLTDIAVTADMATEVRMRGL